MFKRFISFAMAMAVLAFLISTSTALAQDLGVPEEPHGYPAWFGDSNGLKLDLCVPVTEDPTLDLCFGDPVEADNTHSVLTGFGGEAFWLIAGASAALPGPVDGRNAVGELTLALEAAYGGDEAIMDGNQVSFGRVRVRLDIQTPGDYRVTHPYGQVIFENVPVGRRAVNYTKDIGGVNPANPAAAFRGTLASDVMNPGNDVFNPALTSFITWPDYDTNPALLVAGRQYIGDPGVLNPIVGSPLGTNFFRVERRTGADTWEQVGYTELFSLSGRVFDERVIEEKTVYANLPTKKLAAVGPVNRVTPFNPQSTAVLTGGLVPGYPVGYPLWYKDASGLMLTITFPPMGISDPVDPPEDFPLNTAGETFYWSAGATIEDYDAPGSGNDASVEFALEGTFGGDEAVADGNQITFGRLRIRIDTPTAGEYTVLHPYGQNTFVVEAGDLEDGINFTQDIGAVNPFDPDSAFDGAMYSVIGPQFLTWTTFSRNPVLNDALLQKTNPNDPDGQLLQYVGDPAIPHPVKGGPERNYVQILGPGGIDVQTDLFEVTGQVFDKRNFGFLPAVYLLLLLE